MPPTARLGRAVRAVRTLRHWLRDTLFPASGRPYELFDGSCFLLAFALIGYVFTDPPDNANEALQAPLRIVTETEIGVALAFASLLGVVAAYMGTERWLVWGYGATVTGALVLTTNFLVGYVSYHPGTRVLLYVLVFGYLARRLMRDNRRVCTCGCNAHG